MAKSQALGPARGGVAKQKKQQSNGVAPGATVGRAKGGGGRPAPPTASSKKQQPKQQQQQQQQHDAAKEKAAPMDVAHDDGAQDAGAGAPGADPGPALPPTSRLCVKNLPKYVTDAQLKQFFSSKGEVTDAKVLRTRDGTSRQMGFIGFKSERDAEAALKYFDKTFMDATRISVEFARSYKDPSLARPWSKHSEGSSAHARIAGGGPQAEVDGSRAEAHALLSKVASKAEGAKAGKGGKGRSRIAELMEADPKLAEFVALMAPRSRAKLWANDELAPEQTLQDLLAAHRKAQEGGGDVSGDEEDDALGGSSDDEYEDVAAERSGGKPGAAAAAAAARRQARLERLRGVAPAAGAGSGSDSEEGSDDEEEDEEEEEGAGKDQAVVSEAVSDLDYLKSRMRKWSDSDDEEEGGEDDDEEAGGRRRKAAGAKANGHHAAAAAAAEEHDKEAAADGSEEEEEEGRGRAQAAAAAAAADVSAHAPIPDPEAAVRATGRLFLRNLAYGVTEADLLELGGKHGDVVSARLVIDRETKKSKGIAYLQYGAAEEAVRAYRQLDGAIFQGRLLHVLPAKAPSGSTGFSVEEGAGAAAATGAATATAAGAGAQGEGGAAAGAGAARSAAGSSYKATLEEKRRADAGNRAAWNSLFMRPDTVQDAVAAHYGVSKSELLDARSGADVAVRVALGEAAVIQQTKTFLAEQGVNVASLEAAAAAGGSGARRTANVARSPTALLVKNLPFACTEEALLEVLGRSGPVARLVLPPSHALALVEFCEPQDARSAFKALVYKKFLHVPLYLEWAPKDVFTTPAPAAPLARAKLPASQQQQPEQQQQGAPAPAAKYAGTAAVVGDAAEDEETEGSCSIYVKNLAFATGDAQLKKHFEKVVTAAGGVLLSARVARRKQPSSGELVSAGYGFVEMDTPAAAAAVVAKLQGSMLDHHKLSLQLSRAKAGGASAGAAASKPRAGGSAAAAAQEDGKAGGAASKVKTTKLVVRNVAFEATRKDLVGLFSPFGHLKSCRLPKKFDGSHRGFAFVEFVTKQEARNALEGVMGTHLYGRRLVVEPANEEGGVEELRAKTSAKFERDTAGGGASGAARAQEDKEAAEVLGGGRPAKKQKLRG